MQLCITVEPQQGASYQDVLAAARAAEECGFDAFFRSSVRVAPDESARCVSTLLTCRSKRSRPIPYCGPLEPAMPTTSRWDGDDINVLY